MEQEPLMLMTILDDWLNLETLGPQGPFFINIFKDTVNMKTYKEFCLLAESTSRVRDISSRIKTLQDKLRRIPNTPQYSKRRGTIKRAIDKLQREKQSLQSRREDKSINKAAKTIRKYTPEPIQRAAGGAKNFAKYTGAGIATNVALRALGL